MEELSFVSGTLVDIQCVQVKCQIGCSNSPLLCDLLEIVEVVKLVGSEKGPEI